MNIASYIDHTLLAATATAGDITQLSEQAGAYGFAAVCVPPYYVSQAVRELAGTPVKTATVIGFPFGYSSIAAKVQETTEAIADGAVELDMVICVAALKSGDWDYLDREIATVMPLVRDQGRLIKIIIESGVLTDEEIIRCCELYSRFQVQFLKTSTGYASAGASVAAVRLMRAHLPPTIRIKASGGIRTYGFAKELIEAGASRLGCSAGIRIVEEAQGKEGPSSPESAGGNPAY